MKFRDLLKGKIDEGEMKYQALSMAKEIHSALAEITFIEMLSVMSPDNPAKKEVQELETKLNELTKDVGEFIQKYIPDVSDAEANDTDELPPEEEPEEDSKLSKKEPKQKDDKK